MKKALSILLSVMMVAGLFVALIPTATAAEMYAVDMPELGERLYYNDFNNVDAGLAGDALLEELGWYLSYNRDDDGDGYGDTRYEYDKHLRDASGNVLADVLVTESCADGSQAISLVNKGTVSGGHGGTWETLTLLGDDRLAGGDYVIEFDYMALSSHVDGEGSDKVGSSGASAGPMATTKYNSATKPGTYWHYGIKSRGETDIHVSIPGAANAGMSYGGADYATTALGSETMYGMTTAQNKAIKFRIVVSSTTGISAYTSNDGGDTWTQGDGMTEANAATFAANAKYIGKEIKWRATTLFDVAIDNLAIYLIDGKVAPTTAPHIVPTTAPELVITEVSTQATATDNQAHHTLADPSKFEGAPTAQAGKLTAVVDANGNYILPADSSESLGTKTTRYEYLEIYNASDKAVDLSDYSIASWSVTTIDKATLSAMSRIHKGLKVVTDNTDGLSWQFYNDPKDCLLKPGEAAILFMPNNWFYSTPTFGTVAAFKQYVLINEYGYTAEQVEDMKILTLYDSLDELKTELGSGFTAGNGMGINNSGNTLLTVVKDGEDGALPYTYREDKKCYAADLGDNLVSYVIDSQAGNNQYWAWNNDVHYGYTTTGGYAAQYTYWHADGDFIPGGKLDQTRLPSAKTARTLGTVPADLANPNVDFPEDNAQAAWVGYQEANDGSVRLIAEVSDLSDVYGLAFQITLPDHGGITRTIYLEYVYASLTTDFGLGELAEEGKYFMALEIKNVNVETKFQVDVITIYDDGYVENTGAHAFTAFEPRDMFEPTDIEEGIFGQQKDEIDFDVLYPEA